LHFFVRQQHAGGFDHVGLVIVPVIGGIRFHEGVGICGGQHLATMDDVTEVSPGTMSSS
jgi:hypothetical protein